MRIYLTLVLLLFLGGAAKAQKIEFSVFANGGLFHYTGSAPVQQASITASGIQTGVSNNYYGSRRTLSYGAGLQLKLISKKHLMAGLQTSYDILRSSMPINNISFLTADQAYPSMMPGYITGADNASGNAHTTNQFINLQPFIGYRLTQGQYTIDLMPGADIGIALSSVNKGSAMLNNQTQVGLYTVDSKLTKPVTDVRLRMGVEVGIKQWGVMASYAKGSSNYLKNDHYANAGDAYSSLWRMGLSYRIK